MASTFPETTVDKKDDEELGTQMSFLDHLEELRKRLIRSIAFVFVALLFCWFVSDRIYNFLSIPVRQALANAQQRELPLGGVTGRETTLPLSSLKEGETARYAFDKATKFGASVIPEATSVQAIIAKDIEGRPGLFTNEPLIAGAIVIPKGVRLPIELDAQPGALVGRDEQLIVTTVQESFSLYVKVALYAAVCLSVPFLLWQVWAFVSPGLYPHERGYALPFVLLSTISFVIGASFAYYVLFPRAAAYLLGIGKDFRLMLRATDYFDFIILIMLAMGLVFQMPAITYILSRIGLVNAGLLLRIWKTSLVVILVAAAVLSPTSDIPNMMLFALPMVLLYGISIFIAWIFARPRTKE
ncbi:MAG: twin-arginine translocase subunit TatC [Pyrinomonadaceae bacterium]|nr:twin-arginine translocase subunit TatC [Pyrinomonadaceae bacterium]